MVKKGKDVALFAASSFEKIFRFYPREYKLLTQILRLLLLKKVKKHLQNGCSLLYFCEEFML